MLNTKTRDWNLQKSQKLANLRKKSETERDWNLQTCKQSEVTKMWWLKAEWHSPKWPNAKWDVEWSKVRCKWNDRSCERKMEWPKLECENWKRSHSRWNSCQMQRSRVVLHVEYLRGFRSVLRVVVLNTKVERKGKWKTNVI